MSRAVLSVGSNVGDRVSMLQSVTDALRPWVIATSPVYETAPWGPVEQDDFLNLVLIVEDPQANAAVWLARAQHAEQEAGRVRDVRWGPRTLDVDVISVDAVTSDDPELTLPHPRARERAFVLVPWLAADPDAVLNGAAVRDLVAALPADEVAGVRLRGDVAVA